MSEGYTAVLKARMDSKNYQKISDLDNPKLHEFLASAIELCNPESVFVCTDSAADVAHIRKMAVESGEEKTLAIDGHTIHWDGMNDQGRDKANTRYLTPPDMDLGSRLNTIDKAEGLGEVRGYLKDSMTGRTMLVLFFCLGPTNSDFSISGVQLTDSSYVGHSSCMLYRTGYEQFKSLGSSVEYFRVLHSAGALDNMVSADVDKRRIYVDLEDELVYSINTQYAGNTVGFKKLSLRLALRKADREGWLAEHMLAMGVHGPGGRVTYFTGAFPSYCGKTSTSMIPGETIVGDDLAYLRKKGGQVHAVNVECGIFGVVRGVNADDDPEIWKVITHPGEVIFSNVLDADGTPYWTGDERQHPKKGYNYSGEWTEGDKDADGNAIPLSHPNARYTIRLNDLENLDPRAQDAEGVEVGGIIYGGRDSDTLVPVQQSFDWTHGVITMGASLESETTAATLGKAGVRSFQPMSNLDFVSLPLGKYIQNHLDFGDGLEKEPSIFASNYFLKGPDGEYLNGMKDKYVWIKWMELQANGDVESIEIPTGRIPLYEDLKGLFAEVIGVEYTREAYEEQFKLRVPECLAKIDRIEKIYREQVSDTPQILFDVLEAQRARLNSAKGKYGDYVSPSEFAK